VFQVSKKGIREPTIQWPLENRYSEVITRAGHNLGQKLARQITPMKIYPLVKQKIATPPIITINKTIK
jgi:hypothetical protein